MEASQKWTTPKYRAIGYTSSVDESLFGKTNALSERYFIAAHFLLKFQLIILYFSGRRTITGPIPASAAVITASELMRIKVCISCNICFAVINFSFFRMNLSSKQNKKSNPIAKEPDCQRNNVISNQKSVKTE